MDEEKKPQPGADREPQGEDKAVPEKPAAARGDQKVPAESGAEDEPEAAGVETEAAPDDAVPPPAKPATKPAPKLSKPVAKKVRPKRPVKGPQFEDLDDSDEVLGELQKRFPEAGISGRAFLKQSIYDVALPALFDVLVYLREEPDLDFDYLVDLTALDYLGDEKRFCLVYQLYSYSNGRLIRVKSRLAEGDVAPSVTGIWKTSDWLEREIFDMFGVEFSGHPDLRRILLPEDWHGYPLRKDYDIKLQDQSWIRKHLRIRKVPD